MSQYPNSSSDRRPILPDLKQFAFRTKPALSNRSPDPSDLGLNSSDSNISPVTIQRRIPLMVISSSEDSDDMTVGNIYTNANKHNHCISDSDEDDCIIVQSDDEISHGNAKNDDQSTNNCHGSHISPIIISNVKTVKDISFDDSDNEPRKTVVRKLHVISPEPIESNLTNNAEVPTTPSKNDTVTGKKRKFVNGNKNQKRNKKKNRSGCGSDEEYLHQKVYESDSDSEEEGQLNSSKLNKRRQSVINLLDTGTTEELNVIPNITAGKIELIQSLRPFTDWSTTVMKFKNQRGLTTSILNSIDNIILARNIISNLMKKCEQLATDTEKLISSKGTLVNLPPSSLNSQLQLTSYQLIGLNWLAVMRSQSLNSILADEMGLGKTIQTIAFLAYLKEIDLVVPDIPHLIIVPASTLDNWKVELEAWCPSLKVAVYHGTQDERKYLRTQWFKPDGFRDIEVVLTSYSCCTVKVQEKNFFKHKEFNYIIYDEAHMLKNMNSQRYEALMHFNGSFKILLTGTPLQNNLLELMSLLIFLMPEMFEAKSYHLKLLFAKPGKGSSIVFEQEKIEQAKRIMEPFMLRRLKCDVLKDLPAKMSHVIRCPMIDTQHQSYQNLLAEFRAVMAAGVISDSSMAYYMLLRKLANHPLLSRIIFTEDRLEQMAVRLAADRSFKDTVVQYIKDDLYFKCDYELHQMCNTFSSLDSLNYQLSDEQMVLSGKFLKLKQLLDDLKINGHRVLIFSQFLLVLDLLQEFMRVNNFEYLRLDGSTPVTERQLMIDMFNSSNDLFAFLLSTKAGGLGINLTAADTVIIHDIDFNPYNDKQAEDRCHRVGQTKSVTVYRLISEDSIEERIFEIAQNKLHLEKEVTSSADNEENGDSKTIVQLLKDTLGLQDEQ